MKHYANADFRHVLDEGRIQKTVEAVNLAATVINISFQGLYNPIEVGMDFEGIREREKEFKKTVTSTLQQITRKIELATGATWALETEALKAEEEKWHELVESCAVVPVLKIEWRHLPDGNLSWTLKGIEWCYAGTENEEDGEVSVDVGKITLPKLLDCEKGRRMLEVFEKKGYIKLMADGHAKWCLNKRASKCPVAFACFVTEASDYLGVTVKGSNGLPRYRRKELEELFGIYGTSRKESSEISPEVRKEIKNVFKSIGLEEQDFNKY
ncbi:MAG: hypothetical protein K5867_00665 [Bacteroidales bacterium]|nr:hypothetical protein [Bacteroidales bacterium]